MGWQRNGKQSGKGRSNHDHITRNENGLYPRTYEAIISGDIALVNQMQSLEIVSGKFAIVNKVVNKVLRLENERARIGEYMETGVPYLLKLDNDALVTEITSASYLA
ncbi:MAG: hypothetical protein QMC77_05545 [Methanocellales archaeon]|nr:hypothetical protein [Methanocellales archaeon]